MRALAVMSAAVLLAQLPAWGAADFYGTQPQAMDPYASRPSPAMPPPPNFGASLTDITPITAGTPPVIGPPVVGAPPPGGVAPAGAFFAPPPPPATVVQPAGYAKFVQNVRFRYTWVSGDGENNPSEFGMQDVEGAVSFALPNFLFTQTPILVTPGFIAHFWNAPDLPTPPYPASFELPSQVYSAYLDFFWAPQLSPRLAAELDFRLGVYSDFESVTTEAIRPQGYGAGIWQLSPALAVKAGAAYINRVDISLLPVAGVVWTPDPLTRYDITFPNPKLSKFLWTWGTADIWWYVAAEYGGGSWQVESLGDRRMDVNDIRAIAGLEWTGGMFGVKGFAEFGYVFDREVVIEGPTPPLMLDDAFMVRAGLAF